MSTPDHSPSAVLDLPMGDNDANAATIRDYLIALLRAVWREQEGFSGKRPFGNSDWTYDVYHVLVQAGVIDGDIDEEGELGDVDNAKGDERILAAIDHLGSPGGQL